MTDIGMVLGRLGGKLVSEVAPKLEGDYSAGHAGMAGYMAVMAGEAWDGAADRLVNEIVGMRDLLGAGNVEHTDVPGAASVKIGELTVERDALAARLIQLQLQLKSQTDEASTALNARIWQHLINTTLVRMPSPPDFPDT